MRSNKTIRTNDGTIICVTCYTPARPKGKVMIIAPGIGITQAHYIPFARFFCKDGFAVVTFDYRGVGRSRQQKLEGYEANIYQWAVQDINAVLLYAKNNYPGHELIYTGHAIGGEIIGLAPASQYINGIILINSALSCAQLWPWQYKIKIRLLKITVIVTKMLGYFPGRYLNIFGNLPQGVIHQWVNWCGNLNGLFDDFPDNNYRKLNVPLLALTFSDNWQCKPRAVKKLLNHFANSMITWFHITPVEKMQIKKAGYDDFFSAKTESVLWEWLSGWITMKEEYIGDEKGITLKRYIS